MKLGQIISNKSIPIKNALNRTPIFAPIQKKQLNQAVGENSPVLYEDKQYKLTMSGARLNHTWDYPLLALVIKHWKNADLNGVKDDEPVQISLEELSGLYNRNFDQKKRRNFDPVVASLQRLQSACISLDVKKDKVLKIGSLVAKSELHYGKVKKIEVWIGDLLKELYIDHRDLTFINVEKIVVAPSERSKALMKYLLTQSAQFIDFKFELLVKLLGLDQRDTKQDARKDRSYIVGALNELVATGFVTAYQLNTEVNWVHVRIIRHEHCADPLEAQKLIDTAVSNFDFFKPNKAKQKTITANAPLPSAVKHLQSSGCQPQQLEDDEDVPLPF